MFQTPWLVTGALGVLVLYGTLFSDLDEIVGGVAGVITWGLFALGATNIETASRCCVYSRSEPGLALLGLGLTGVSVAITLKGTILIMRPSENPIREALNDD
jgi:hypothetical protein